jgi:hypothetical protein
MKSRIFLSVDSYLNGVLVLVLLALTSAFSTAALADEKRSSATPSKFVGTYAYRNQEGNISDITTLHKDGTSSTVSAIMYSDDLNGPFMGRRVTPRQGVWRVVGKNKVRNTQLAFLTGVQSHDYLPDGVIMKISWLMNFDAPVKGELMGYTVNEIRYEIFLPSQNPTTDEPVQLNEFETDGRAYRLLAK